MSQELQDVQSDFLNDIRKTKYPSLSFWSTASNCRELSPGLTIFHCSCVATDTPS